MILPWRTTLQLHRSTPSRYSWTSQGFSGVGWMSPTSPSPASGPELVRMSSPPRPKAARANQWSQRSRASASSWSEVAVMASATGRPRSRHSSAKVTLSWTRASVARSGKNSSAAGAQAVAVGGQVEDLLEHRDDDVDVVLSMAATTSSTNASVSWVGARVTSWWRAPSGVVARRGGERVGGDDHVARLAQLADLVHRERHPRGGDQEVRVVGPSASTSRATTTTGPSGCASAASTG